MVFQKDREDFRGHYIDATMSDVVIKATGLSKRYTIRHEGRERYTALRDVLAGSFKKAANSLFFPPSSETEESEDFYALKNISFEVRQGERVGIVGHNGAGKSTLLKVLSRITEPSSGSVEITGRVASLLEVGTGFHPELTGRENIYLNGAILGMKRDEICSKFDAIVSFAEVERFLDTPVKRYSSGMYVRLAFAVAAHLEPEILLVDEVLAVGDAHFQRKSLGKLERDSDSGRTVLFVSHNVAMLNALCQKGLLLNEGRVVFAGTMSEVLREYDNLFQRTAIVSGNPSPHALYSAAPSNSDFEILKVELLDEHGCPKNATFTADHVRVRFTFRAASPVQNGSILFKLATKHGITVLLCSTRPDSNIPMFIAKGESSIVCTFPSLPLCAGDYILSAGLAIPSEKWLCYHERMGVLSVHEKNMFGGTVPPALPRSILAIPHSWSIT